ncbi:MAG: hypothetical protein M3239_01325 [Thermoproteota archaeon]|nr:hypothetical protein [Thermoproteota archaeon]
MQVRKIGFKLSYSLVLLVNVALVEKSSGGLKLSVYNENLTLIESNLFNDSYTLNFYLQTLARKHRIEKSIVVVHDKDRNAVSLSLAQDENSFFVS